MRLDVGAVRPGPSAKYCDLGRLFGNPMPTQTGLRLRDGAKPDRSTDSLVRLARPGARWRLRGGWQERLLGPHAPDWFDLEHERRAEHIKSGHLRNTWRVALDEQIVFAKVIELRGWRSRLKHRLFGAAVSREWRASLRAESIGVPVVRCLAFGHASGDPTRLALLTQGQEHASTLLDAWLRCHAEGMANEQRSGAVAIIDAVVALVSAAHDRGFVHGDEHPNNILLAGRNAPAGVTACYVDTHAARFLSAPVAVHRTLGSLAQLDQLFHRIATRTQRLRFFKRYFQARSALGGAGDVPSAERQFLRRLALATERHAERLARHWDRRIGRDGKYFKTLKFDQGWKVTLVSALERPHVFSEVSALERPHVFPEVHIPEGTEKNWRAILEPILHRVETLRSGEAIDHGGLRTECDRPRGLAQRIKATVGRSPARRVFERCHRLRHRDIYTELILAYGERRRRGLVDRTILVHVRPPEGPVAETLT